MTRLAALPRQGADLATALSRSHIAQAGARRLPTPYASTSSSIPSSSRRLVAAPSASRSFSTSPNQALATEAPSSAAAEVAEEVDASTSEAAAATLPVPEWTPKSRRVGLMTRKKGMVSYFLPSGERVACTILQVDDCQISAQIGFEPATPHPTHDAKGQQLRIPKTAPYMALQVAAGNVESRTSIPRPVAGHLRKAGIKALKRTLREFKITADALVPLGTELSACHFVPGQVVDVQADTRGKGFAGAMKRHGFKGLRASHGTSISHRSHGSTGANSDPARVLPGKKMAGRMGGRSSTQVCQVLRIDTDRELIYVKGHVPGPEGGEVAVRDSENGAFWKAIARKVKRGAAGSDALPEGILGLPFPAGTKQMAASLPKIVEWTGKQEPGK